jgi:hypothetical protein
MADDVRQTLMNSTLELFSKYNNNPYILHRLEIYLTNLPTLLENENKRHDERVTRINELTIEQDNFYKVFLSKNQYYYMPYNNIYYEYDGKTYKIIKEDDIHHNLLSTITDEGKLVVWKYKTKQNIIKKIKDRNLLKSTPETFTIQNVLSFLNTIFETKAECKYFLTLIGDCILKKNTCDKNLLYFVSSNFKKVIGLIDNISYVTTGNTILNNFISKYHESHDLNSYRLIKINDNVISYDFIKDVLNKIGIDLLCVACHYSDRYENADNYLKSKAEEDIKKYTLFFTNNTIDNVINDFKKQCIQNTNMQDESYTISWKNMHYIWKQYLSSINIPNVLYSNTLKDILKTSYQYEEPTNNDIIFKYVTSKYLPNISSFVQFWETHIIVYVSSKNVCEKQYEIDELFTLYKINCKNMNLPISSSEVDIIKIINHFYPEVDIVDNKYINNILCCLWTKCDELDEMLSHYKSNTKVNKQENSNLMGEELVSFDELYEIYRSYAQAKIKIGDKNTPIISKQYFENYIIVNLNNYIKYEKFVSLDDWLQH